MSNQEYAVRKNLNHYRIFNENCQFLSHLDIELTERCNNACVHCYINLPENDIQSQALELTTQQWKDIIQQATDLGALSIRFTGGEPLLREDFQELYLFTRKLGMKVMLFTNARLITPELADLFVRVPLLNKIEVSVYGMCAETYDTVSCRSGAFNEFRRGINLLIEHNIPFVVKSVLLPQNRLEKGDFEEWAASIPGMDHNPPYAVFLDLRARRDSLAKNHHIKRLRLTPQEGVKLLGLREEDYRKGMVEFCSRFMGPSGEKLFACGAGESGCVDAYGKYQMCMLLRHPDTVFDLSKGTLKEALTEFFPQVRELKTTNPDYLRRCARCFLKGLCEQCPAKSWSEHGTLDTPVEYLCQVAHAQARFLGLLKEKESAWEIINWQERVRNLVEQVN